MLVSVTYNSGRIREFAIPNDGDAGNILVTDLKLDELESNGVVVDLYQIAIPACADAHTGCEQLASMGLVDANELGRIRMIAVQLTGDDEPIVVWHQDVHQRDGSLS